MSTVDIHDYYPGGRHIKFDNKPLISNLLLSMINKLGIPMETFGDSTGILEISNVPHCSGGLTGTATVSPDPRHAMLFNSYHSGYNIPSLTKWRKHREEVSNSLCLRTSPDRIAGWDARTECQHDR
jgi:hypothetical protein